MKIKGRILVFHNYPTIVIPSGMFDSEKIVKDVIIEFEQPDGKILNIRYEDHLHFNLNKLPNIFTLALFGITGEQMKRRLHQVYPYLTKLPEDKQFVNYLVGEIV
jgi:hypothetical protein